MSQKILTEEEKLFKSLGLPLFSESCLGEVLSQIDNTLTKLSREPVAEEKVKIFTDLISYLTINIKTLKSIPIIYTTVVTQCRILQRDNQDNKEFYETCQTFFAL